MGTSKNLEDRTHLRVPSWFSWFMEFPTVSGYLFIILSNIIHDEVYSSILNFAFFVQVTPVHLVLVSKVTLAVPDRQVIQDKQVQPELQDHRDSKASRDLQGRKVDSILTFSASVVTDCNLTPMAYF